MIGGNAWRRQRCDNLPHLVIEQLVSFAAPESTAPARPAGCHRLCRQRASAAALKSTAATAWFSSPPCSRCRAHFYELLPSLRKADVDFHCIAFMPSSQPYIFPAGRDSTTPGRSRKARAARQPRRQIDLLAIQRDFMGGGLRTSRPVRPVVRRVPTAAAAARGYAPPILPVEGLDQTVGAASRPATRSDIASRASDQTGSRLPPARSDFSTPRPFLAAGRDRAAVVDSLLRQCSGRRRRLAPSRAQPSWRKPCVRLRPPSGRLLPTAKRIAPALRKMRARFR